MLESSLESSVCKWAEKNGITSLKVRPYKTGYPDHMFLYNGLSVFIEFKQPGKKPGKKPSKIQLYRIEELLQQGFPVGVFDDRRKAISFLDTALISRARRVTWHIPGLLGPAVITGSREDHDSLRSDTDFAATTADKESFGDSASKSMLQRLARSMQGLG